VSFEDAAEDLLNDYKVNGKKTHDHAKRRINLHLKSQEVDGRIFAGRRLASITTSDIRKFMAARLDEKAAPGEINRELSALKRMDTLAVQAGKLHGKPYIPMLQEDNVRRGFFEPKQFASVDAHLPEALRPLLRFAYLTGWRLSSEVLPIEWQQIDWEGRVVRLDAHTTKNGDARVYPFTVELETLLRTQLAEHERLKKVGRIIPHVVHRSGRPIKNVRAAWVSACTAAGCPGRLIHDLRRTAVRNLERAGVPRSSAMAMVGHKTESIYRRYAIMDAGALRDAAAKIDLAGTGTKRGDNLAGAPSQGVGRPA
jgi:integrase